MATKETPPPPPAAPDAGAAPPKSKIKLLIIISAAVVFVLFLAIIAFLLLTRPPAANESGGDETAAEESHDKKKSKRPQGALPVYMTLDDFVVNLNTETNEQYLQLSVTLELEESQQAEHAKAFMPKIRNQVMLLLSGKRPVELATKEGKEKLAKDIRNEVNKVLGSSGEDVPSGPVMEVLFTSFIIQ